MKKKPQSKILLLITIAVFLFGLVGLKVMENLSASNGRICTYIGRLWMPEKNGPKGVNRCYTYEEYYK
jgi:hypothetical protein